MAQKKIMTLEMHQYYDEKIKEFIASKDSDTLDAAKDYTDGLATNYDAAGSAATVQGKLDEEILRAKAREDEIAAANSATQKEVDDLETLVGTLPQGTTATSVVDYVNVKTAGIATDAALGELQNQLNGVQGDVNTIKGDYLKAADKTELQGNIDTVNSTLTSVKEDVDAFFANADMTESAKDTLKELQTYIASDETAASEMLASIQENGRNISSLGGRLGIVEGKAAILEDEMDDAQEAIAALQEAVGDGGTVEEMIADAVSAETTAREQAIADVQADADKGIEDAAGALAAAQAADSKAQTAQNEVDALEGVVATKAAASDVTALTGRVTTNEGNISTLQTKMTAVEGKASANETAIGALNTTVAGKASQNDLDDAIARIAANETSLANFIEITSDEIDAMFQQ